MSKYRIEDKRPITIGGKQMTEFKLYRLEPGTGYVFAGSYTIDGRDSTDEQIIKLIGEVLIDG